MSSWHSVTEKPMRPGYYLCARIEQGEADKRGVRVVHYFDRAGHTWDGEGWDGEGFTHWYGEL